MEIYEAIENYEMNLYNKNLSEKTIDQYLKELGYFRSFLKTHNVEMLNEIRLIDIERYLASLIKNGNMAATRARKKSILDGFFSYSKVRGYVEENPTEGLHPVKVTDADQKKKENLSLKEERKLKRVINKYSINPIRNLAIIDVFLNSALRVEELCKLKWNDLDEDGMVMRIEGKGGKVREVVLFDEVLKSLKEYKKTKVAKSDYIFTSKNSANPMKPRSVLDIVKKYARMAKINKNIGCHSLRRTSATNYLREGVNPRYIQLFLGHSDISTTTKYMLPEAKEVNQSLRKARKALNKKK